MTDLLFYDAAVPPPKPPKTDGVAFYIGGDAYHVWSKAEIDATTCRYRLPIFVRSHPEGANPAADVAQAVVALHNIGAPKGCLVAWDTETAADPAYMRKVYELLTANGYKLIDYGSQDNVFANQLPVGGYYWGAEWNGDKVLIANDDGTQYANDAQWDLNIFRPGLPFWDTAPAPVPTTWQEHMMQQLPTVQHGAAGATVRTIQGLCNARGYGIKIDGIFGTATMTAVSGVQQVWGVPVDGIVGPKTWPVLLGIG